MKIISLKANNIKKLTAVEITPAGEVVTLAGNNGAGKSSVLDSIAYALGGTSDVCEQPIRRGESEAEVVCQLPGLTVTRRFNAGGSTLKVTDSEGRQQRSPQAILDALIGNLAFDPLEFSRKRDIDQAETLRRLVGIDFTALNAEYAKVYEDRLLVGREADILKGKLFGNKLVEGLPAEEVAISDELARKNAAESTNRTNKVERDILLAFESEAARVQADISRIVASIDKLEQELRRAKESYTVASSLFADIVTQKETQKVVVDKLVDEDTTVFDKAILEASKTNEAIRLNKVIAAQLVAVRAKDDEYSGHTDRLEEIAREKKRRLAETVFPLPELGFSEAGGVTYNGFPFAQASDGEKLRVSVAIGMALNPKLRVIFIRDGSLLDTTGLQTIAELAKANDYQVWLEDARSVDPTAVVIEDGKVKV